MMKKVSIIIPIYNTKEFLPTVFESLLSQTYGNIEIVAVDDGSTDGSLEVCRDYAKRDGRVKLFAIENSGVSQARNFGLENAEGEFVMFLDSDDTYTPDAVEKLVRAAEASGADIVSAGLIKTDGVSEHRILCNEFKGLVEGDALYSVLYRAFLGKDAALCSFIDKMYSAEFLRERNIRFPRLNSGEDTVFALEAMICASHIYFLEDHCFYRYVLNENSFTQKKMTVEKRIEYSNLFFAECEKLIGKYGMTFLEESFLGRRALAVYDFVMNTVAREDLSKKERLGGLERICGERYYTDITDKEIMKKHSFRVRRTAYLASKGKTVALYRFASFLHGVKKLKRKITG